MNRTPTECRCSCFLPFTLLALALLLVLGWNAREAYAVRTSGQQVLQRNVALLEQAAATEGKLRAMLTDLVELAKTDPAAQAIVAKYDIRFNAGQPSAQPPAAGAR
jgi:hypothetical protein